MFGGEIRLSSCLVPRFEIFDSLGFLDLEAALHSLNPQMTTDVKIYVQEMLEFSCFSSKLCFGGETGLSLYLVPRFGNF